MNDSYTHDVTSHQSQNTVNLEGDLLVIEVIGNQSAEDIDYLDLESVKLIESVGYKINILIDISRCGIPDKEARRVIMKSFSRDGYNAQAIYGMNEALKVVTQIILDRIALGKRTKLFNTKEEAVAWLKTMPPDKSIKPNTQQIIT